MVRKFKITWRAHRHLKIRIDAWNWKENLLDASLIVIEIETLHVIHQRLGRPNQRYMPEKEDKTRNNLKFEISKWLWTKLKYCHKIWTFNRCRVLEIIISLSHIWIQNWKHCLADGSDDLIIHAVCPTKAVQTAWIIRLPPDTPKTQMMEDSRNENSTGWFGSWSGCGIPFSGSSGAESCIRQRLLVRHATTGYAPRSQAYDPPATRQTSLKNKRLTSNF